MFREAERIVLQARVAAEDDACAGGCEFREAPLQDGVAFGGGGGLRRIPAA